jgi:methylated-DNA-[protein]-cysteine S-methyltransferase
VSRREIRSGRLSVTARFEGATLREINLPRTVPDFTANDLQGVIEQLRGLPISFAGAPPFHQRVWERLRDISWGSAMTYAELARSVGSPRGFRAVGQACGANPVPLIVPCHRVLAEDGIGGFSGGAGWKERLLEVETAV